MNEREKFMYSIIGALSKLNAPIVFKGALVLKVFQAQTGNKSGLIRETQDIDGDWIKGKPSMGYLVNLLEKAVKLAGYNSVKVVVYREYSESKSAGFKFINSVNDFEITSLDLSIRENKYGVDLSYIDGINFKGQRIDKIIADKITAISSKYIFRRIKDLVDIYILTFIYEGSYNNLIDTINISGRVLSDFTNFLNDKDKLIHAYSRYKNKASTLPFDEIYDRCFEFLNPFISGSDIKLIWNCEKGWFNE